MYNEIMDYKYSECRTRLCDVSWYHEMFLDELKKYLTTVTGSDDILYLPCDSVNGGYGSAPSFKYVMAFTFLKRDVKNYENIPETKKSDDVIYTFYNIYSLVVGDYLIIYMYQ